MKDHEQYAENVGAYLLGALPELEAEVFERHAMGCASCREELERMRPAAEALPRAVPQVAPPPELREAIMREVRGHAFAVPAAPRRRLPRLPRIRPAMAWVSAAVIIVAGVLAGVGASSLLGGDDESRVVAADVDRQRLPDASATLLVPDEDGAAVLSVHGLRPAVGSQVYVVWVQRGSEVIFESSFNVRPDGSGKAAVESLEGVDRVMVTRERSPDVAAPSESPVISVATS